MPRPASSVGGRALSTRYRQPLRSRLPSGAVRLYLVFNVSQAANLRLAGGPGAASLPLSRDLPANVIALDLAALKPNKPIEVHSQRERPELVRYVVEVATTGGTQFLAMTSGTSPCADSAYLWEQPVGLEALYFGPQEYHNALESALGPLGPDTHRITRYRWYFFDLDRRTDAKLAEVYLQYVDASAYLKLGQHLGAAMGAVGKRIAHRFVEHGADPFAYTVPTYTESERNAVAHFSRELLRTLLRHFHTASGLLDFEAIEEAFEMFANGELRLRLPDPDSVWTTQPSSGLYFFFAEFALLAAELGHDRPSWERLADVFVRTQRIYCDVYAPGPAVPQPGLTDYYACAYDPGRTWTDTQKARLREEFEGLSFAELCRAAAAHTRIFMPGGVDPMP